MITIATLIFVFLTGFSIHLKNPEKVTFEMVAVPQGRHKPLRRAEHPDF